MSVEPNLTHSYGFVNESFVHLAQYSIGTSYLTCPGRINKLPGYWPKTKRCPKVIFFVPGNPGVLGIYHDFLNSMFKALCSSMSDDEAPVLVAIGHNNFDHPSHSSFKVEQRIYVAENELNFIERSTADEYIDSDPNNIELQVLNKALLIKKLLNLNEDECQISFVGHSIGCYVILRLLQDKLIAKNHRGSILIHPALENLAKTQGGSRCVSLFAYKLDYLLLPLAYMLDNLLPQRAKLILLPLICSNDFLKQSSESVVESIVQLVCRLNLTALFEMAKSEMKSVKGLDAESTIKPHAKQLKMIYAKIDRWVNSDFKKKLKALYPSLHVEEHEVEHAFMMNPTSSSNYADRVSNQLKDFI